MIIDIHTHVWSHDEQDIRERLVRECRRSGVALAFVSSVGDGDQDPSLEKIRRANAQAAEVVAQAGQRLRWLAYLNPRHASWREELAWCRAHGAIGIKLWVSLKDEHGRLEATVAVLDAAAEQQLPALIHTFNRTDPNLPGEIDIEEFAALAERVPRAVVIGAHAGANWRHSLGVLRHRAPNAHVDVSGIYPQRGIVRALVDDIGAERILFGSDGLNRSLPSQIAKVVFADITAEQKEQILWQNAARLFRLEDLAAAPDPEPELRPATELPDPTVDHFCFCGRWPFFETPCATPADLEQELGAHGIAQAFVGDLGSIYRLDLARANRAFGAACAGCRRIAPLAVVNPRAHNWRQVLAAVDAGSAGVIVYPCLHDWRLDDPAFAPFFQACAAGARPVWINAALDDDRFRHSGVARRGVRDGEVAAFVQAAPSNRYVFQGVAGAAIMDCIRTRPDPARFRFEISRLTDATGLLDRAVTANGLPWLVMGSEFPLRDSGEVWWTAQRQ